MLTGSPPCSMPKIGCKRTKTTEAMSDNSLNGTGTVINKSKLRRNFLNLPELAMPKRRMYSPLKQHSIVFMLCEGLIYLLLALARQFELGIARIEVAHSL